MSNTITGRSHIGFERSAAEGPVFRAYSPATGTPLPEHFFAASTVDIEGALSKSTQAFELYKRKTGVEKADFLDAIGAEIVLLGDSLVDRAVQETGLPQGRIVGERGRTVSQLKMFADLLREGSWVDALIDTAIPDREPVPKPDVRTLTIPVGPVVVFTASNFPLAFSTAGGDTASALAAGNPVIVKAHESHPGTNELVATAVIRAAKRTGMPDGVFSSLNGIGYTLGTTLVKHEVVKSVAFTGSYSGGMALYKMVNERNTPIPMFAEMGSTNPVVVFPDALKQGANSLGSKLAGSILLGAGQFCTNPGLVILPEGENTEKFLVSLSEEINSSTAQTMLNEGIHRNYNEKISELLQDSKVKPLGSGKSTGRPTEAISNLARVSAADFLANPQFSEEVFGPSSLAIVCEKESDLVDVMSEVTGQLTATVICTDEDVARYGELMQRLTAVAGRLIFNGVPTGVEVCHAMQHGGPFPATTDSRFTSVGAEAIKRFVRPLCYQDAPQALLPPELQDSNPLGIWRKVNGELTKDQIR